MRLHPEAIKTYRRLRGSIAERIASAIDGLAISPRPAGAAKLAGPDDFRIRVGEYRVVYASDDQERLVIITTAGSPRMPPRSERD